MFGVCGMVNDEQTVVGPMLRLMHKVASRNVVQQSGLLGICSSYVSPKHVLHRHPPFVRYRGNMEGIQVLTFRLNKLRNTAGSASQILPCVLRVDKSWHQCFSEAPRKCLCC